MTVKKIESRIQKLTERKARLAAEARKTSEELAAARVQLKEARRAESTPKKLKAPKID